MAVGQRVPGAAGGLAPRAGGHRGDIPCWWFPEASNSLHAEIRAGARCPQAPGAAPAGAAAPRPRPRPLVQGQDTQPQGPAPAQLPPSGGIEWAIDLIHLSGQR